MTCPNVRLVLDRLSKKVTGRTLRFLPSYPEQLRGDFASQPAVQRGSRPKQQVIGTMFGFLPNDLSTGRLVLPGSAKKR